MRLLLTVAASALVVLPGTAQATPTQLDTSFGSGGAQDVTFPTGPGGADGASAGRALVRLPSGDLVVGGGSSVDASSRRWVLAGLAGDGALRPGFGTGGKVALTELGSPGGGEGATALAYAPAANAGTGALLVAGQADGAVVVHELTQDGHDVTSFGSGGRAAIGLPSSSRTTASVVVTDATGVMVAGTTLDSGHDVPFVARFTAAGLPDPTFDQGAAGDRDATANGVYELPTQLCDRIVPNAGGVSCQAESLALDGTALVVGIENNAGEDIGAHVARLTRTSSGLAPDPAFGTGGQLVVERHELFRPTAIVDRGGGAGYLVAGAAQTAGTTYACAVISLSASGVQRPAKGTIPGAAGTSCILASARLDETGRLLATGVQRSSAHRELVAARFTSELVPDPQWAPGGVATLPFGGEAEGSWIGLTLEAPSRPLVVGATTVNGTQRLLVARFEGGDLPGVAPPAATVDDTLAPEVSLLLPQEGQRFSTARPEFVGQAGRATRDQQTVAVHLSRLAGGALTPVGTESTPAAGGEWRLTWPRDLEPGHYAATATQDDAAGNQGHSATVGFDVDPDGGSEGAGRSVLQLQLNPTDLARKIPSVRGKPVGDAQSALRKQLVFVDLRYFYERGRDDGCTDQNVGRVIKQDPAAGIVHTSADSDAVIKLTVCFGGSDKLAGCDISDLRAGVAALRDSDATVALQQRFVDQYKACSESYDVRMAASSKPDDADVGKVVVTKPKHGRGTIRSVIDCPRNPQDEALRLLVSEGAAQGSAKVGEAVDTYGLRASGPGGWTLPAKESSFFAVTVVDRAWRPVAARIYVDPSAVHAPGFTKVDAVADDRGRALYKITPGQTGSIELCAVVTEGDQDLYGTVSIRVSARPAVGEVWETISGRRIVVRSGDSGPVNAAPRAVVAHAASGNPFADLIGFITGLFGGRSQTVDAAAASPAPPSTKLASVYHDHAISPAQLSTCGGALGSAPPPPVTGVGPVVVRQGAQVGIAQLPVVKVPGSGCGPVLLGLEGVSAAEGKAAGLISQDGTGLIGNAGGTLVAAGSGNLLALGVGTLISQDGSGLISQDGSGLISQDGSGIVSHDGGGIAAKDGAGIVSHDGGGIAAATGDDALGPDVATLVAAGAGNLVAAGAGNLVTGAAP